VSADEAARIATDGVNRLLASRRLVLVLDLDHTLLNTVRDCDLVGEERQHAQQQLQRQAEVLHRQHQQQQKLQGLPAAGHSSNPQADSSEAGTAADVATAAADAAPIAAGSASKLDNNISSSSNSTSYSGNPWEPQPKQQQQQLRPRLFHLADKGLWTKLRPGVESFLAHVAQLYELHIYTMGDKGYAGLMADLLDPQHKLFVGRVISAVSAAASVTLCMYSCRKLHAVAALTRQRITLGMLALCEPGSCWTEFCMCCYVLQASPASMSCKCVCRFDLQACPASTSCKSVCRFDEQAYPASVSCKYALQVYDDNVLLLLLLVLILRLTARVLV
jgi:hypothetical protein